MLRQEGARLAALLVIFSLVANPSQAKYASFVDGVTYDNFVHNTENLTCPNCSNQKGNYTCECGIMNVECGVPPHKYCDDETYEELRLSHYSRSLEFEDGSTSKHPGIKITVQLRNTGNGGSIDDSFSVRIAEEDSPFKSRCFDVTIGGLQTSRVSITYDCLFPLEWNRRYKVTLLRRNKCFLLYNLISIPPPPDPVTTPSRVGRSSTFLPVPLPLSRKEKVEEDGAYLVPAVPLAACSLLLTGLLVFGIKRIDVVNWAKKWRNSGRQNTEAENNDAPTRACPQSPQTAPQPHSTTPPTTPVWLKQGNLPCPAPRSLMAGYPSILDWDAIRTIRAHAVYEDGTNLLVKQCDCENLPPDGDVVHKHQMSDLRLTGRPQMRANRLDSGFHSFEDDVYIEDEDEYIARTAVASCLKRPFLDRLAGGLAPESRTCSMNTIERELAGDNDEFNELIYNEHGLN